MFNLVVRHAFGTYAVGDTISDDAEIAKLLPEREAYVVRVARQPADDPQPMKPSKD